jgi:DNA-binding PadR family transcriptional regulator
VGISDNNRKARIYKLTPAGRKRLAEERRSFDAMMLAIGRVMEA